MIVKLLKTLLLLPLLFGLTLPAAHAWPTKPIRIIVPAQPGSSIDFLARVIADKLGPVLGTTVVVEDKAGASGMLGTAMVANATDGHTFLAGYNGPMSISPLLSPKPGYDVEKDFAPIIYAVTQPNVLAVRTSLGVSTVTELVALAKKNPDKLNYASAGVGTISSLSMEYFKAKTGTKIVHVPYNGGPAAVLALGKEEVDVLFTALSNLQPLEKAGKVKLIAIANGKKSLAAPHLPTLHESGFRGFDATTWNGFFAPANTPESVIQQLHKEIAKILAQPEVQERLLKVGAETVPIISPAEFGTMVKKETAEWKKVIHDAGLTFD